MKRPLLLKQRSLATANHVSRNEQEMMAGAFHCWWHIVTPPAISRSARRVDSFVVFILLLFYPFFCFHQGPWACRRAAIRSINLPNINPFSPIRCVNRRHVLRRGEAVVIQIARQQVYNISLVALPTAHPFYLFLLLNRTLISFANIQSFKSIEIQIKSIDWIEINRLYVMCPRWSNASIGLHPGIQCNHGFWRSVRSIG